MSMFTMQKKFTKEKIVDENWKNYNEKYIKALERFLDRASNIKDEELRQSVIGNMLICDEILTELSEKQFVELYKKAYKEGKKERA